MNKKKIGIVAKKLNHSLSPFIHNHWAKKNNNKFIYRKYEVQEKKIDKFFDNYRRDKQFVGLILLYHIKKFLLIFVIKSQQEQIKSVL